MSSSLAEFIPLLESRWKQIPVLVVGDVMLDRYIWGEVQRISPEAPVPVVRVTARDEKPGGAANVAMNLAGLGARVSVIGFAGGDHEQTRLEDLLRQQGIESRLVTASDATTVTKLRILSGHQQMMRVDLEEPSHFTIGDYQQLVQTARPAVRNAAVLVLSDYAKGTLSEEVCQTLIHEARERGIPVLVDPKSRCFDRYRGATTICPNLKELAAAVEEESSDLDRVLRAGQQLLATLDMEFMLATLGEKGIAILRSDLREIVPAAVRQVFDVSGAGDTVAAVMALVLASGADLKAGVQLANLAAGIVVGKVGTVAVQRDELLGVIAQQMPRMEDKVVDPTRLLQRVSAWKASGRRVVFTNGCFDILHIGHVQLLEEARRKGDCLIVAMNSDDSVRSLKGPLRPIVRQDERARVLAALGSVDAVIIFGERTPLRLIEAIRPDVLVKGGDYSEESVVGAREVRSWGGRVELIPLVKGVSTTRLISAAVPSAGAVSAGFSA